MEQAADEVDVGPPQRQQLALAQSGERGHPVDRRVLVVVGVGGQQLDLVAVERVELARVGDLWALDLVRRGRVVLQAPDPLRPLEDPVKDGQVANDGSVRQLALGDQPLLVGVDQIGSDRFQADRPELVEQIAVDHTAVVAERPRVDPPDVAGVAQELGGRVRERDLGGARHRASCRHRAAKLDLGLSLGQSLAGARLADGSELALDAAFAYMPLPVPGAATDAQVAGAVRALCHVFPFAIGTVFHGPVYEPRDGDGKARGLGKSEHRPGDRGPRSTLPSGRRSAAFRSLLNQPPFTCSRSRSTWRCSRSTVAASDVAEAGADAVPSVPLVPSLPFGFTSTT